ncbi:DUF3237 domain-containing protein [Pseudooceanicola sp. CBS1P-1]|uniref:DUF3237 domain-containing protein n=1 Tax=Pseudooceanicola endophyticus TaxID=2841273 RepID=UPI001C0180C5|nr:DUF3237 domain-containing protein [Pseudooceanicola endophyticus]MBT9386212.1 DUF3237 domain-containing protein [Pseudooceanicola endophyticus]
MPTPIPAPDHVFTLDVHIARPRSNGAGINGERKHIEVTGGTVQGPRLRGKVLSGGSDWLWQRPDGVAEINAHYSLETEDGTLIYVQNRGLRVADPAVRADLIAGRPVDPSAFYFRAAPVFDAPDGPFQWLRETLFVSRVTPCPGGVTVDVFRVP